MYRNTKVVAEHFAFSVRFSQWAHTNGQVLGTRGYKVLSTRY